MDNVRTSAAEPGVRWQTGSHEGWFMGARNSLLQALVAIAAIATSRSAVRTRLDGLQAILKTFERSRRLILSPRSAHDGVWCR